MGWDRYQWAVEFLEQKPGDLDVPDCFSLLRETAQALCPTVVSMVFDTADRTVYWCENREWDKIEKKRIG